MTPSEVVFAIALAATVWMLIFWGWACATA
jgi:hypothetical protein